MMIEKKLEKYLNEGIIKFNTKLLSNDTRRVMAQLESAADKGYDISSIIIDLVSNAYQDGYDMGYQESRSDR